MLDLIAGRSLHSITNQRRREGAKTSLGNEWTTRSLKLNVQNPRICGWREINGELVRDPAGNPVVGQWEPIVTPEQWMAVKNIFDARRGHYIHRDGRIGHILTPDFREPNYLLTGFLRCGRAKPDGSLCNTSLRVTHSKVNGTPPPAPETAVTVSEWHYAGSGHRHGEAFWAEVARQRIATARKIAREQASEDR